MTIRRGGLRKQHRGQALVTVALSLVVLMGFVGLAVDIGMLMVGRNELQNAADAAALAGAQKFYESTTTPNWSGAEALATTAIGYNKSMKAALSTGTVASGYWNLTGTPAGMQSKTKTPVLLTDAAAVSVQIRKAPGTNGGSIALFLAPLVGVQAEAVQAYAVAVSSFPSAVDTGAVLPVAITKCLYDNFWDATTNSPKIDPATGQVYEFKITSSYHTGPCEAGQWTSLLVDANDVPTIRDLIENGNPNPLKIGDMIWIEPGTKTTLYGDVPVGTDVLLPVVTDISTHARNAIVGFGAFHIDASVGGSGKYIQGHFITNYKEPFAVGGGPSWGAVVPPMLVR